MSQYVTARRSFGGLTRVDMEDYFDDMEIENLYQWIDRIPLTRPKKNLAKDFSDGVLVAEMIKHYFPRMVELHNYTPAHSSKQKMENWYLLNRRVLRRLDLDLSDDVIRSLANAKTKVIERVLMMLRSQLDKAIEKTNALKQRAKQLQEAYSTTTAPTRSTFPAIAPAIDNVAKSLLEEKELESMAKDETIRILYAKLKRLEHLLHLKDLRIEDLESRLNHAQGTRFMALDDM
ncbi:hypothetical protein BaRGS_00015579 [Batillaria attramentaria]|uniref:Calponin-homology (CH) domain-containing protein n=1 Tax=Batillaria attramentaria TaxID=370345 RepID=A0ABD0L2F0_9CAEN